MIPPQETFCPHLGLYDDPRSLTSYPSEINICHLTAKKDSPSLDHQSAACLTAHYASCPVYQAHQAAPAQQETIPPKTPIKLIVPLPWLVGGSTVAIALTLILLWGWIAPPIARGASNLPTTNKTTTSTAPAPQVYVTSEPSPTPLIMFTPTILPTVPPGLPRNTFHRLDVQIGFQAKYLMYLVKGPDTLQQVATRHKTIPLAIRQVNYKMVPPLTPGEVIVIPFAAPSSQNLPWLEAYQVPYNEVDLQSLAVGLGADIEKMKYLNMCLKNCLLKKDDWVLVPHEREP